jgi:hypothetical protein
MSKFIFIIIVLMHFQIKADDKITTVPLINLEELKPSFEEEPINQIEDEIKDNTQIKNKNKKALSGDKIIVNLLGLDKITAKTTEINIKIGETKNFGLLQIKAIRCGRTNSISEKGDAAYIQIKDISDNQIEKIFVFNGWTFSSSPSLRPIDHPVYDLWLVNCDNI